MKWVEKILKYNPREKPLKVPFAIYLDLECLLKKETKTISKNHIQRKKLYMILLIGQCLQDVHLMKKKINKRNYYRGKDCIEKLCKKLKERAMKIMNYEKRK